MARNHCPPSRRGHTWRELLVPTSQDGPTIRELYALRRCARCAAIGRVDGQGRVVVVEDP